MASNPDGRARYDDLVEALGGADAVEKTTYVDTHHPGPDGEPTDASTSVAPGGGTNVLLWLLAAVALVIGLVYGVGLFM